MHTLRALPLLVIVGVAIAGCGGRDEAASPVVPAGPPPPALAATWRLGAGPAPESLTLAVPLREPLGLAIRVTNRGPGAVQVARSSYPSYRFFRLEVRRAGEATVLPAYFDLYPTKDLQPPAREYVILEPGAWVDREVDILLREGYLLATFAASEDPRHLEDLRAQGYGAMREAGTYEVVGIYSTTPRGPDGRTDLPFEGETGRDPAIPLAEIPEARTPPLRIVIAR